ncbi:MAG: Methionyl-tRNA formyltransferase [Candidatus Woesebacteria bacterium GW2011_GWB1_39_12]|uniref:methionyl-tRNA formyltransferase n=2 Tax=Candidatus Woeseibacteriota TaxID=1752722 RepID=A0A0G0ME90_9BACT|nr:MAG: Methionyl-tRNA formyltransferase [Candidatus Woesebacteria bacterium GW2011_GWA1_39_12]KKR00805.1 MAG: Methionyl-tRNA formyltransferase [Candidatus Woesebacteria bacterium GW2011_GWB1_39_12]
MKIIFFGTPDYVVPVLESLHRTFKPKTGESPIAAVVTQAPKPTGRKQELSYSPVDTWAFKKKVPKFFDPEDILKNKIQADLGVLASYGTIIPAEVINHFPHGILNIHPSLLPKWRGSSPIQAIIISEDQAGATIIKIDEKLDHGPIISQFKDEVLPEDTTETLRRRLFERSAEVLTTLIPPYLSGKIIPREQDHKLTTFTRETKKEDAFIPPQMLWSVVSGQWSEKQKEWKISFIGDLTVHCTPITVHNFIRAMQPWPTAWTFVRLGQRAKDKEQIRLKILKAHLESIQATGSKLPATKLVPSAQCLVPDLIQLEGKSPVSWKQFLEGYPEAKF